MYIKLRLYIGVSSIQTFKEVFKTFQRSKVHYKKNILKKKKKGKLR